jgi:hypothetical protein
MNCACGAKKKDTSQACRECYRLRRIQEAARRPCSQCGVEFQRKPSQGRANGFCSPECHKAWLIAQRPHIHWTCEACGAERVSAVSRKRQFCSRRCATRQRMGVDRQGQRERACAQCRKSFWYVVARGVDRLYCSSTCRNVARRERWLHAIRAGLFAICSTPNCGKRAVRVGDGLCEACYGVRRRTGGVERRPRLMVRHVAGGYVRVPAAGHPTAASDGWSMEHRVILYDAIGPGPHPCYWCGKGLASWTGREGIIVDHLNEDKGDNRLENLLPTCNDCNRARGAMLPFLAKLGPQAWKTFVSAANDYVKRAQGARQQVA